MAQNLSSLLSKWDKIDDDFFDSLEGVNEGSKEHDKKSLSLSTPPDTAITNISSNEKVPFEDLQKNPGYRSKILKATPMDSKDKKGFLTTALRERTNFNPTLPKKIFSPIGRNCPAINMSVRKRKFPGPAGLLPSLDEAQSSHTTTSPETLKGSHSPEIICSQSILSEFQGGTWAHMLTDLPFSESDVCSFINKVNIRWVLRKSVLRGQTSLRKVPFLVVMIKNIDLNHTDATATFCDKTGEMNGTIAADILEKYLGCLKYGSVLVLKDVTVLSPASLRPCIGILSQKKCYLNITLNSLIIIYYNENDDIKKACLSLINEETLDNIMSNYKESILSYTVVEEKEEDCDKAITELFDNVVPQISSPYNRGAKSSPHIPCTRLPYKKNAPPQAAFSPIVPQFSSPHRPNDQSSTPYSISKNLNNINHSFKPPALKNQISSYKVPNLGSKAESKDISSNTTDARVILNKAKNNADIFDDMDDDLNEIMASIDVDSLI